MTEVDGQQEGGDSLENVLQQYYDGKIQAEDVRRIVEDRLRVAQPDSERISRLDILAALGGGMGVGAIGAAAVYILDALTKEPVTGIGELAWRFGYVIGVTLGLSVGIFGALYLSRRAAGREMMKF